MFETSTPIPPGAQAAAPGERVAGSRPFPAEHEAEFLESQAAAPQASLIPAALGAALLFHGLLITEFAAVGFPPVVFLTRGLPVTLVLVGAALLPARLRAYKRALFCLASWGAIAALLAGWDLEGAQALLTVETGIASLLAILGWASRLPFRWAALLSVGMLAVDGVALASEPGGSHALNLDGLKLQALFAPAFATAFALMSAWMLEREARRDFLSLRTAAFAGVNPEDGAEETRHLDPVTGVGSRAAFDMRVRAAWEQAVARRNSVALLLVSIDDFAERKREFGHRYGDLLQTKVAGILKEGLRRSDDMVARYDAQHFVVMLPGVGTDGVTQIAERLRGSIEELAIYLAGQRHSVTATLGVASLRAKKSVDRDKLIECAARALEQAKHNGPNTVCVEGRGCLPRMV